MSRMGMLKKYEVVVDRGGYVDVVCKLTGRACPSRAQCATCLYPMMARMGMKTDAEEV